MQVAIEGRPLKEAVEELERRVIEKNIETGCSITELIKKLDLNRSTFYKKLSKYNIVIK